MNKSCLICGKSLPWEESMELVEGGGFVVLSFHYGSRHDQLATWVDKDKKSELLRCDEIRAYICDDCFENKLDLFEGWNILGGKERMV